MAPENGIECCHRGATHLADPVPNIAMNRVVRVLDAPKIKEILLLCIVFVVTHGCECFITLEDVDCSLGQIPTLSVGLCPLQLAVVGKIGVACLKLLHRVYYFLLLLRRRIVEQAISNRSVVALA